MAFEHVVTVRFHEVDRAGIVFFGRVFEYCHVVFEELLHEVMGAGMSGVFEGGGWGMPLVHAEADYKNPMRIGDRLRIALEVERLGDHSVTLRYTIRGPDDGLRAVVRLVHAFVDLKAFHTVPTPREIREGLARFGLVP
jgi:YbgC/YbaW family acyl-CoA thioester hydrolase